MPRIRLQLESVIEQVQSNTREACGSVTSLDPLIHKLSAAFYDRVCFCREHTQLSKWQKEDACEWHASHLCDSPEQASHPGKCFEHLPFRTIWLHTLPCSHQCSSWLLKMRGSSNDSHSSSCSPFMYWICTISSIHCNTRQWHF